RACTSDRKYASPGAAPVPRFWPKFTRKLPRTIAIPELEARLSVHVSRGLPFLPRALFRRRGTGVPRLRNATRADTQATTFLRGARRDGSRRCRNGAGGSDGGMVVLRPRARRTHSGRRRRTRRVLHALDSSPQARRVLVHGLPSRARAGRVVLRRGGGLVR